MQEGHKIGRSVSGNLRESRSLLQGKVVTLRSNIKERRPQIEQLAEVVHIEIED